MALNDIALKNKLKTLFDDMSKIDKDPQKARELFADKLSGIISEYVRSADVFATPLQITASTMSNGGGPVVAANNLNCTVS